MKLDFFMDVKIKYINRFNYFVNIRTNDYRPHALFAITNATVVKKLILKSNK